MPSVKANYYIRLKDQTGTVVAIFDNFASLHFTKEVNGIGQYEIQWIDDGDDRFNLFELDGQIEVWRSAPGMGVDWYLEFEGLHRGEVKDTDKEGKKTFTSYGVGYNHLLTRRVIGYRSGTIRAEKNDYAEDVVKEYVKENAGSDASHASRVISAVFPDFSVEAESASHDTTPVWTGDRAFYNLLDVCQEISRYSFEQTPTYHAIDFAVVNNGDGAFIFRTYLDQLGTDRSSGSASPVIFSVEFANMQDSQYEVDRVSEANVAIVLGQGDRSTRVVVVRSDATTKADSPWNHIEVSRPATQNDYTYQLNDFGDAMLREFYLIEDVVGEVMQVPSTFYGLHYFLGDRVVVSHGIVSVDKKINVVDIMADGGTLAEVIKVTFGDERL